MNWRQNQTKPPKEPKTGMPYSEFLHNTAPTLHEFLTVVPDGCKPDRGGTVLLFAENGRWVVCLNDRPTGFKAFVSDEQIGPGFLEWLNKVLEDPETDWRPPASSQKPSERNGKP